MATRAELDEIKHVMAHAAEWLDVIENASKEYRLCIRAAMQRMDAIEGKRGGRRDVGQVRDAAKVESGKRRKHAVVLVDA